MALTGAASAATLHVGSGYSYSTIQAGIEAASSGDVVRVHSGTYSISTMISAKSGVSIVGDGVNKTIIKASSASAGNSSTYPALIYLSGDSNIIISDLSVLGYYSDWTSQHSNAGHNDYGIGINIRGSSNNVTVHDVYMDALTGDGVKVSGSSNTNLYNLKITTSGHDAVCMYSTSNCYLNNSYIDLAVNTGIRFDGATNCLVQRTTFIQSNNGTGAGYVELENTLSNCTVTKNAFLTSSDPVVWFASADGGSVNIYNNILYGCPAMVSSLSPYSGTFSNNTKYTTSYDWADMGYGYNAASTGSLPIYNGSALPTLSSPSNGATTQTINGKQTFSWSDVNSTQYRVYVASDADFTTILADTTVTSPSASIALDNGTYYWRIKAYVDTNSTWSGNTSAWSFTVSGNTLSKSGAYGIVYDTSTNNPIEGAVVTLMNTSWSQTYVTADDGFYSFTVPKDAANGSIYYLSAIATDYIGSYSAAGSGLPLNMTAETYEENIALTKSPTYVSPTYVVFTVQAPWGTKYEGVTVNTYRGESSTAEATGLTDAYGKVTFKMEQDTSYRIACIDDNQNVNVQRTLYPSDSAYTIWVYGATKGNNSLAGQETNTTPAKAGDYIGYGKSVADFNMTYGLINQTVVSKDNQTVTYTSIIKQLYPENGTETGYYIDDVSGSTGGMDSWSVAVPSNYSYTVTTTVVHPSWTEKYQNTESVKGYTINPHFDFGWENQWNYEVMGYALVLFAAGLTSYASLPLGILSVLGIASLNLYIGWWHLDTTGQLMFTFGWLLGLGYILTKRN